jgi:hypothetical protein
VTRSNSEERKIKPNRLPISVYVGLATKSSGNPFLPEVPIDEVPEGKAATSGGGW